MYQNNPFRKDNRKQEEDPFSHFLFGKVISPQQQPKRQPEQRYQQERKQNQQRFQRQQQRPQQDTAASLLNPASIEKYLNNIDINLLNENIDMLMKTAEQFKPLYNELNPIIMKFLKKK